MQIAIVSDSHDNLHAVHEFTGMAKALSLDLIIHAGDIVSPFSASSFTHAGIMIRAVFGNNDGEVEGLKHALAGSGTISRPPYDFTVGGRRIVVIHDLALWEREVMNKPPDILVHGHTHRFEVAHRNGCLRINPGELGGWITASRTFALLDLDSMQVEKMVMEGKNHGI